MPAWWEQDTAHPFRSVLYLEGGEGVLKRHPSSCTKEDLREAKRREAFPLVKLRPADKPPDVTA